MLIDHTSDEVSAPLLINVNLLSPVADPATGWWGRGGKKHEIYAAAFSDHLFYDLFLKGGGGMAPSAPLHQLLQSLSCPVL